MAQTLCQSGKKFERENKIVTRAMKMPNTQSLKGKCFKIPASTNEHMLGSVVLEIACGTFNQNIFFQIKRLGKLEVGETKNSCLAPILLPRHQCPALLVPSQIQNYSPC